MRLKKLKRSRCVVLPLVLKRQWYDLIESGETPIERVAILIRERVELVDDGRAS